MISGSSFSGLSRGNILKTSACLTLGSLAGCSSLSTVLEGKGGIALVSAPDNALANAVPPQWALGDLTAALKAQGATALVVPQLADAAKDEFCVVIAAMNAPVARKVFGDQHIAAPTGPQSLVLVEGEVDGRPVVLAAVTHSPVRAFRVGKALEISLGIAAPTPRRVTLHYRRVNQAERWQSLEMNRDREVFRGEIPAACTDHRFALQYYFEIQTGPAAVMLFPARAADLATVPYCVVPCTSFSGFPYQAGAAVNRFRGAAVHRTSPPRVPS